MTTPLLQVKNLRIEFPTRRALLRALDGVSFHIDPGEVLGVVGESGAGKSLTGAAIIGLLEPPGRVVSGTILLDGTPVTFASAQDAFKRGITAIHQETVFEEVRASVYCHVHRTLL